MTTITFKLEYFTQPGMNLLAELSRGQGEKEFIPMTTTDGHTWQFGIDVEDGTALHYTYLVVDEDGNTLRALPENAFSLIVEGQEPICVTDRWAERPVPDEFLHTAFTECIFNSTNAEPIRKEDKETDYSFVLHTTPPPANARWAITGQAEELGAWHSEAAQLLRRTGMYAWSFSGKGDGVRLGTDYKYLLIHEDEKGKKVVWEEGENRHLLPCMEENVRQVIHDDMPRIPRQQWRGAGVVIPVFSLRSRGSQGCGDFGDLKKFVEWAAMVGFSALQVLPVNDTSSSLTWRDAYPYNSVSVFALHPLYLDMREWKDLPIYERYVNEAEKLNALPKMDYEETMKLKMRFLSDLFLVRGKTVRNTTAYMSYVKRNAEWLHPYSEYAVEKFKGWNFSAPPEPEFFCFVQYLLHGQLLAAHDKARSCGVILKGDIPIGICRDSVPATTEPHLFRFNGQAGAPPDAFAVKGQNWGFPTYNWEEMEKDNYAWWRKRLSHMSRYFDAYRLDHVLGFFRIWEIPTSQYYGTLGYFRPALPLSREEISCYGFRANIERGLLPFITSGQLEMLKREFAHENTDFYFTSTDDGYFTLAEGYRTQREIGEKVTDADLRNRLMDLAAEVLFIADPDSDGLHPRIGGQLTAGFAELSENDKQAYNHLHDDFFYNRHNDFWAEKAMHKLPALIASRRDDAEYSMLPCAEDLGMVPVSVKGVLDRLHILSLEIQRMPKQYGKRFDNPEEYPYLSVATIATHDMAPLRLWWHEDKERANDFWHVVLGHEGEAPAEASTEICEEVVEGHLNSPSMLCLIALQDYLGMDANLRNPHFEEEKINDPANANQYWQYRMHLTIEQLVEATAFNEKIRTLIVKSGRH